MREIRCTLHPSMRNGMCNRSSCARCGWNFDVQSDRMVERSMTGLVRDGLKYCYKYMPTKGYETEELVPVYYGNKNPWLVNKIDSDVRPEKYIVFRRKNMRLPYSSDNRTIESYWTTEEAAQDRADCLNAHYDA